MLLYWYACISTNTCCFETHHILLETNWWALPNASSIVWIRSAVHEILADEAFTATDGLISQSFVVAFVHSAYVQIVLIWSFPAQLSSWKLVHWLWKYKLNEVCDKEPIWTLVFLNARIAGNGVTQCFHAKYKNQSTSNATVPTSQKTTANLNGIAKQTKSQTYSDLKQRKGSHVLIHSSAQTAKTITKLIPICVHSRGIDSTGSGNKRNIHENRTKSICSLKNGEPQQWSYKISKYFHKMFGKTSSLSTSFLRLKTTLTSSLSKNSLGLKFIKFPAL